MKKLMVGFVLLMSLPVICLAEEPAPPAEATPSATPSPVVPAAPVTPPEAAPQSTAPVAPPAAVTPPPPASPPSGYQPYSAPTNK